jgi:hypothetical protein
MAAMSSIMALCDNQIPDEVGSTKLHLPISREAPIFNIKTATRECCWSLELGYSLVLGVWCLIAVPPVRRLRCCPRLFSRIRFRDNQAHGVLIESFETAFALQILQITHDRPSP